MEFAFSTMPGLLKTRTMTTLQSLAIRCVRSMALDHKLLLSIYRSRRGLARPTSRRAHL
jgi:hypothetical protein